MMTFCPGAAVTRSGSRAVMFPALVSMRTVPSRVTSRTVPDIMPDFGIFDGSRAASITAMITPSRERGTVDHDE